MPQYFVLENVTSLQDGLKNNASECAKILWACGYWVTAAVFECSDFALPQRRERYYLIGERINKAGRCCINGVINIMAALKTEGTISLKRIMSDQPKFPGNLGRRAYTTKTTRKTKWLKQTKAYFLKHNIPFRLLTKHTDVPKGVALGDTELFFTLQQRHRLNAVFCHQYVKDPEVQKELSISHDSIVLADVNCSISWCVGALAVDASPCITTKSILVQVWPTIEPISDYTAFNLQGLDANDLPNVGCVSRRDR